MWPLNIRLLPAARALEDPEHVRAPVLDLLPLAAQPHLLERLAHQLGHRLLAAREARHADRLARRVDEPLAIDPHGRRPIPIVAATGTASPCSPRCSSRSSSKRSRIARCVASG